LSLAVKGYNSYKLVALTCKLST